MSVEGSLADGDNGSVGGDVCWWRDENCDQTFPSSRTSAPRTPSPRKLSSQAPAPLVNVRVQT